MNKIPTPTRHGDWQMVDGQLVDVSQQPQPEAGSAEPPAPKATPPAEPTQPTPAHRPRRNA